MRVEEGGEAAGAIGSGDLPAAALDKISSSFRRVIVVSATPMPSSHSPQEQALSWQATALRQQRDQVPQDIQTQLSRPTFTEVTHKHQLEGRKG